MAPLAAKSLFFFLLAGCPRPSGSDAPDAAPDVSAAAPSEAGVLNVTPLPAASIAQMVNPQSLPAYSGPTGSVEGTVYVTGDPPRPTDGDFSKCPDARALYGHAFREGPVAASGDKSKRPLVDAVVGVTGYQGFYLPEKNEAEQVTIEGCGYTKRTVTMTFGQRLEVKNESKDFWTPKLEPDPNLVMMMAAPKGDPAKIYPKKPGHWLLMDHDRKYVVVDLYVFLFPLHTSTDSLGRYRIDGLPANTKLKVSARHPQIGAEQEQEVTVENGVVKTFDFVLKNAPREAGAPDASSPSTTLH